MSASILDLIKEETRLEITGDKYYQNGPYAFVLRGPPYTDSIGPLGYTVFPLPVNPTDLSYALPFSCEITPLQEGGVVAEEAGICIGELVLDGTTGFKTRLTRDTSFGPGGGDFTGLLGHGWAGFDSSVTEISGQLAFWRLANRCFDAYSALKKDPRYAHQTTMEYHSQKDELHLQIVPREFSLRRTAGRERVSYRYSIRAAVVGAAAKVPLASPDKGILDKIRNTISTIREGMAAIAATVDDLTSALDSIRRTISSAVSILTDVGTIMDSFTSLVDGTKKFLDIPKETLGNVARLCEDVAEVVATTTGWPADVQQAFLDISDQLDALTVASTDLFVTSWQEQARRYDRLSRQRFPTIGSRRFSSDTTYPVETVFATEKPGDIRRAAAIVNPGERLPSLGYNGFAEYVVGQGDSLQSLAAKHLGDASKWIELAVVNDLKAPYITSVKLPQTLRVGDKISVPIRGSSPPADTITTGDKLTGASQSDKFLGEDFKFVAIPAGLGSLGEVITAGAFGWEIDVAGGSTDVIKISGIPNVSQALGMRFRTEQGANILYPAIGLPRLIGVGAFGPKLADARHQARIQILADKRIERLARFAFSVVNDDLVLEADVQPAGYSTTRTIARTLT